MSCQDSKDSCKHDHKEVKSCHTHTHSHEGGCCGHHHHHSGGKWYTFLPDLVCLAAMLSCIFLFDYVGIAPGMKWMEIVAYIIAALPVGIPILRSTLKEWASGSIFNEFTLMVFASVGAYLIGEYAEGVAVLLFYSFGEKLEGVVSGDVKGQIRNLLGKMPKTAAVIVSDGSVKSVNPSEVKVGDRVLVKPGMAVPLDGKLCGISEAEFDTSAMTGESVPRSFKEGEEISSGMIPVSRSISIEVSRPYSDSAMMRIMNMIEDASKNRAKSETILRKITKWYTPLVMTGAILLFVVPWILSVVGMTAGFVWTDWFRRSLVFLVCSCPCALIVSIPLTYFSSIGIASRKGVLFKGHRQLDDMRKFHTIVFDKTGTVTTGKFHVENIHSETLSPDEILAIAAAADKGSAHPLAQAICEEAEKRGLVIPDLSDIETIPHGISALQDGKKILVGSPKLLKENGVGVNDYIRNSSLTCVCVAVEGDLYGVIELADTPKEGVDETVRDLHSLGVYKVGILSGDSEAAVKRVASLTGVDFFRASLLPAQKSKIVAELQPEFGDVAFVGDGINDAPALAQANVGIAMGTLGSDLAIESADVVIAGDDLRKIPDGIRISRKVKSVLLENVIFAFGVKILVMILGAFGIASLWAAVFADTGVTLVTVIWTLCRLKIWQLKRNES